MYIYIFFRLIGKHFSPLLPSFPFTCIGKSWMKLTGMTYFHHCSFLQHVPSSSALVWYHQLFISRCLTSNIHLAEHPAHPLTLRSRIYLRGQTTKLRCGHLLIWIQVQRSNTSWTGQFSVILAADRANSTVLAHTSNCMKWTQKANRIFHSFLIQFFKTFLSGHWLALSGQYLNLSNTTKDFSNVSM